MIEPDVRVGILPEDVLQGSSPFSGAPVSNSDPLHFGRWAFGGTRNFAGLIDEVAIHDRALSATEIGAIFGADGATDAGGPYTIKEGDLLTLDASATIGTPLGFTWDVNGDGTFGAPTDCTAGNLPTSALLADGNLDTVTANRAGRDITVLLGDGLGSFGAPTDFAVGNNPVGFRLQDIDGDGVLDFVTTNFGSDDVTLMLGNSDGTFGSRNTFAVGDLPLDIAVGDLDGDGDLDGVTANYDGTLSVAPLEQVSFKFDRTDIDLGGNVGGGSERFIGVSVGDLDGDGRSADRGPREPQRRCGDQRG